MAAKEATDAQAFHTRRCNAWQANQRTRVEKSNVENAFAKGFHANMVCQVKIYCVEYFLSKISSSIVRYWDMDIPNLVWNCQVSRSLVGLSIAPSRFKNKNIYMLGTSILWSATVYEYLMQFSALDLKILECNYRPSTSEKNILWDTTQDLTEPYLPLVGTGKGVLSSLLNTLQGTLLPK